MRFVLNALVAAIAAFAATSAAAGEPHYYTITLQEAFVSKIDSSPAGSAAKVDGFTVKQGVKPYKLDRVFVKSWSTSGDADSPPTRPIGPSRMTIATASTGSCTVGKRFPSATLVGGGKSYKLTDVTIADCGPSAGPEESITFVYSKMIVKY